MTGLGPQSAVEDPKTHVRSAPDQRTNAALPSNGWSWYGLAELYKMRGKADQASKLEADLAKTWIGDRQQLELSKL
jgi:hypothetical protein